MSSNYKKLYCEKYLENELDNLHDVEDAAACIGIEAMLDNTGGMTSVYEELFYKLVFDEKGDGIKKQKFKDLNEELVNNYNNLDLHRVNNFLDISPYLLYRF